MLVNEGSAIEYRFPAGTTLMDANLESRLTIREYVDRVYPLANLSNEQYKCLGSLVAKAAQAHNPGTANLVMKKSIAGERYAPRMYFVRDLDGPPLDSVIEDFVKSHRATTGEKRKRVATTELDKWLKPPAVVGRLVGRG